MKDNQIWGLENMESTHNDSEIDESKTDDDEEVDENPSFYLDENDKPIEIVVPPIGENYFSNFRVIGESGNSVSFTTPDHMLVFTSDLANPKKITQHYSYIIQIKDDENKVLAIKWFEGSVGPGESVSPKISWIPETVGRYHITSFVWEGIEHPKPLGSPQQTVIEVT